ncbi:MAG TPA: energy-coupling factor transporter ATPase [Cellulomonas sp.]
MIELSRVRFSYSAPDGPEIVRGLDLAIAPGERVALLGANGSGKSTVARLVNGLNVATSGRVLVDGHDVSRPENLPPVRRLVQLVFQNPENQQVGTTVFQDIAFGLAGLGAPTGEMRGRAQDALETVGLDVGLDRDVLTLSGGELQRLALASVVALEPRYLVLDEITAMLDPAARATVLASVARLHRERGVGVVQITHHLDEVVDADRVVVVGDGVVQAEGSPAQIFADGPLLVRYGLRAPYRWQPQPSAAASTAASAGPSPSTTATSTTATGAPAEARVVARGVVHDYGVPTRGRRARATRRELARAADPLRLLARPTLTGVDLAVRPGDLLALAGRSGAGKSTLVSILKGLLEPTLGTVHVDGTDPWAERDPAGFDRIGYVFQQPERQFFAVTVHDDVAFGLTAQHLPPEQVDAIVAAALRRVGLDPDEVGQASPFALSGGQQRRAAFAGVLVGEPDVLVLDEPTAGLDEPSRAQLFAILDALRADGVAIVWVSHRLEEILEHADRLVVLDGGTVVADDDPATVIGDPAVRARLGWPLPDELDPDVERGAALHTALHPALHTALHTAREGSTGPWAEVAS